MITSEIMGVNHKEGKMSSKLIGVYVLIGFALFLILGYTYLKIRWYIEEKRGMREKK
jgi:CHASE3 domain sensor protein